MAAEKNEVEPFGSFSPDTPKSLCGAGASEAEGRAAPLEVDREVTSIVLPDARQTVPQMKCELHSEMTLEELRESLAWRKAPDVLVAFEFSGSMRGACERAGSLPSRLTDRRKTRVEGHT